MNIQYLPSDVFQNIFRIAMNLQISQLQSNSSDLDNEIFLKPRPYPYFNLPLVNSFFYREFQKFRVTYSVYFVSEFKDWDETRNCDIYNMPKRLGLIKRMLERACTEIKLINTAWIPDRERPSVLQIASSNRHVASSIHTLQAQETNSDELCDSNSSETSVPVQMFSTFQRLSCLDIFAPSVNTTVHLRNISFRFLRRLVLLCIKPNVIEPLCTFLALGGSHNLHEMSISQCTAPSPLVFLNHCTSYLYYSNRPKEHQLRSEDLGDIVCHMLQRPVSGIVVHAHIGKYKPEKIYYPTVDHYNRTTSRCSVSWEERCVYCNPYKHFAGFQNYQEGENNGPVISAFVFSDRPKDIMTNNAFPESFKKNRWKACNVAFKELLYGMKFEYLLQSNEGGSKLVSLLADAERLTKLMQFEEERTLTEYDRCCLQGIEELNEVVISVRACRSLRFVDLLDRIKENSLVCNISNFHFPKNDDVRILMIAFRYLEKVHTLKISILPLIQISELISLEELFENMTRLKILHFKSTMWQPSIFSMPDNRPFGRRRTFNILKHTIFCLKKFCISSLQKIYWHDGDYETVERVPNVASQHEIDEVVKCLNEMEDEHGVDVSSMKKVIARCGLIPD